MQNITNSTNALIKNENMQEILRFRNDASEHEILCNNVKQFSLNFCSDEDTIQYSSVTVLQCYKSCTITLQYDNVEIFICQVSDDNNKPISACEKLTVVLHYNENTESVVANSYVSDFMR